MPAVRNCLIGLNLGFPDVCLTPLGPVILPIPYPNINFPPTSIPTGTKTVYVMYFCAQTMLTKELVSLGDIPGTTGVASGIVVGPCSKILGSFTTFKECMPSARSFMDPNLQNMTNCPGMNLVPSQVTYWCFM